MSSLFHLKMPPVEVLIQHYKSFLPRTSAPEHDSYIIYVDLVGADETNLTLCGNVVILDVT